MTVRLSCILRGELTDQDLMWIKKNCEKCWENFTVKELLERVENGQVQLYRIEGDAEGILGLSRFRDGVFVECLSGRGILEHFAEFYDRVKTLSAAAGALSISGYVGRPGLRRVYDKYTKAQEVTRLYTEAL